MAAPVIESSLSHKSSVCQGVKPCEGPSHSSIRLPPPRTHEEDNLYLGLDRVGIPLKKTSDPWNALEISLDLPNLSFPIASYFQRFGGSD